jgi:hypothetical protein
MEHSYGVWSVAAFVRGSGSLTDQTGSYLEVLAAHCIEETNARPGPDRIA